MKWNEEMIEEEYYDLMEDLKIKKNEKGGMIKYRRYI